MRKIKEVFLAIRIEQLLSKDGSLSFTSTRSIWATAPMA